MATINRKEINLPVGQFWRQPGGAFHTSQWGLDSGTESWLTRAETPRALWPKRGTQSTRYTKMFITDVEEREDESGLILLTATYRGLKTLTSGPQKVRVVPGCDISMFTLPSLQAEGSTQKRNVVVQVPKPQVTREYLTTTLPTLTGVGVTATGTFFPELPSWSVSFIPDPDQAQTLNYHTGWVLDSRNWEEVLPGTGIYSVREVYSYFYSLAA